MEEKLSKSEKKYRVLLENLPQKIFHKDENSVYVFCNKNYADDLKIKLTAEREGGIPSSFKTIHAHFIVQGDINPKKVERAVRLSMEKYCSVGFILAKSCEITWSYDVNGVSYKNVD